MRARWALLFGVVGILATACRERELPPGDACRRIEPLKNGAWTEQDRALCAEGYASLPRASRVCLTKCIEGAKTGAAYEDCSEDCGSASVDPVHLCKASAPEGAAPSDDCIVRMSEARKRRPAAYACVTRCARHAPTPAEAAGCEAKCGLR